MKVRAAIIAFACLLLGLVSPALGAGAHKTYPLTRAEAEDIISEWLGKSGFTVSRAVMDSGGVSLRARKGSEEWVVKLRPDSPLACSVEASYYLSLEERPGQVQSLWNFLSGYLRGSPAEVAASNADVPAPVLARAGSVVCITARSPRDTLQFSGFFVNEAGLILSTAHTLDGISEVNVTLPGGETMTGRIVRADPVRDLALIDVARPCRLVVDVGQEKKAAPRGGKLFSVGCPENLADTVYPGFVSGPPRIMAGQRLLQVSMKVYPGSSGSPVFDEQGGFVAVVKGRRRGTDSVGFLIPRETVLGFLKDKARGKPGRSGT